MDLKPSVNFIDLLTANIVEVAKNNKSYIDFLEPKIIVPKIYLIYDKAVKIFLKDLDYFQVSKFFTDVLPDNKDFETYFNPLSFESGSFFEFFLNALIRDHFSRNERFAPIVNEIRFYFTF